MSEYTHNPADQTPDREVPFHEKWVEAYLRRLGIVATEEIEPESSDE